VEIYLTKQNFALYPATDDDAEKLMRLKKGVVLRCEVKQARNYEFLKKYFSLINCAYHFLTEQETEAFNGVDHFRKQVEIASGWCTTVWSIKRGEYVDEAKSISFGKMSQDEFNVLYDNVKNTLFSMVLKGRISETDFINELINY